MKYEKGTDDGEHRPHIDVNAGSDGTQSTHCKIPGHKTDGRGPQTQVEQVQNHLRMGIIRRAHRHIEEKRYGNHEQDAVGKGFPRVLYGIVAVGADFSRLHRVECPHYGGQHRQKISEGIQLHPAAIEADEKNSA